MRDKSKNGSEMRDDLDGNFNCGIPGENTSEGVGFARFLAGDMQVIIKLMTGCEKTESHTLRP